MIERFTKAWFASIDATQKRFVDKHPESYADVVKIVVEMLSNSLDEMDGEVPDPARITQIDYGDYQGTLVYVVGANGYQPSTYWYVLVSYGSCSGCDTLERIRDYSSDAPTQEQVRQYMQLALNVVQELKVMGDPL